MKRLKYIVLAFGLVLITQSCREEFLDEPKPTDVVSADVVYGSFDGAMAHIAGIRRRARGQFTATDSGNDGSIFFARENKGNISINGGSWFAFDYENQNREPNYRRTVFNWEFPYYIINQVNAFIEGVEGSEALSQDEKNTLLGQALTMRAFYYFQLSLEFQNTYALDPNAFAPPIYTKSGSVEGNPLSTMQEMYKLISDDLEEAISIGSMDRDNKSYFNKAVSYAIAARVYLVMGNWAKAEDYAHKAYGGNANAVLDPSKYRDGFDDMSNKEWLLADPQTSDQSTYYYLAPHGFYTREQDAYNNTFINKSFVALFSNTDVRNQFAQTGVLDYRQWYTRKFVFSFDADYALIRYPEMILVEAEAMFKNGKTSAAHDLLFQLQHNRDPQAVKSTNSGQALYEEILTERKKELYGEIGVEWFDAKRLQRGLPRDSWHRVNLASDPMKPNDKRFYLKIPQKEIDSNPNISKDINNNR